MISESYYWKLPLLEMADRFRLVASKEDLTDEEYAAYERDLFIGFYSVRKLFEGTAKVSDETRMMKLQLLWFPKKVEADRVDWYNRGEIWELYELEEGRGEQRDAIFVAHRIIHRFIFMPTAAGEGNAEGIFFTSDVDKDKRLYFVSLDEVIRLFTEVGTDYPDLHGWTDPVTRERKWRATKAAPYDPRNDPDI